jgi:hypothetical protein
MIRNSEALEQAAALIPDSIVVERDDGLFQLGLCPDAAGPFRTRQHATAVARKEVADAESA